MKETEAERFQRELIVACRDADNKGRVQHVSRVKDITELVTRKIKGQAKHTSLLAFKDIIESFTRASCACLVQDKPSLLVYVRNVSGTQRIFDYIDKLNSDVPSNLQDPSGKQVHWVSKPADVYVYFGDEFIEGRYRSNGPNLTERVKDLVTNAKDRIGQTPVCPVCLEAQVQRMQVAFKCTHSICSGCVANIIQVNHNKATCPLCRSRLRSKVRS